jgi:4-amino-4-deoxy-L-arabinose transferase-like glycosyltransferase
MQETTTPFLSRTTYSFLYVLLAIVYIIGLFVPLMDNDSAHHANIALRMHLTGDYVNLVDYGKDYLDKPHFHFWLAALSYKIFGVSGFAYKLPSFLFSIAGVYATYRLGKALYNKETGRLAALILASSFAFILSNNDVRMDAILTSCVALATWQLVEFVQHGRWSNVIGAALALSMGFCTKGHIALVVPGAGILFYTAYTKSWKSLFNGKLLLMILLFLVFITPVVYCYYLQYNLHPEKVVRGKDHINGVKFILLGQSVERFQGDSFGADSKHDYLFFIHSFLWAFAPWSIIAYLAIGTSLQGFKKRRNEWLTPSIFIIMLLLVSFSGFKLPHYLNIVFPSTAVVTAAFILSKINKPRGIKSIFIIQLIIASLFIIGAACITLWAFPVRKILVIIGVIFFLSVFFYFIQSKLFSRLQKSVLLSVAGISLAFFLLNANFYPQLLKYQAGNELAIAIKGKIDPERVFSWKDTYSSSFYFYTKTLRKDFNDSVVNNNETSWLLVDKSQMDSVHAAGYEDGKIFSAPDYEITKLQLKFINPNTRESQLGELRLIELKRKTIRP